MNKSCGLCSLSGVKRTRIARIARIEILFGGFVRFVFFFLLFIVDGVVRMWGEDAKKWENVMEFAIFLLYLPI